MKFVVESVRNGCRLGRLSELGSCGERVLQTPLCMLYTRAGSAPHLTQDMLQKIPVQPDVTHIPLPSLVDQCAALEEFQRGMKLFAAMKDTVTYCSVQDPAVAVPEGFNDKSHTAVWTKGGKVKLDPDAFMKCQAAIRPDIYQAMCDCDTDKDSGKKRLAKSVDRTLRFLDSCLRIHQEFEQLKNSLIFGSLVGGYSEYERIRCARETASRPVDGFCIDGFHHFGSETENFAFVDIQDLLEKTLVELPPDKPRLMHHVWSPDNVIKAIGTGIDIFDSSYVYIVSERGGALVFDHSLPPLQETTSSNIPNGPIPAALNDKSSTSHPFEINLNDKRYAEDFGPLVADCKCYTCQNHTRAYINHLLNTTELLAGVLLMLHNVHHYSSFFAAIREALKEDRFTELEEKINSHIS